MRLLARLPCVCKNGFTLYAVAGGLEEVNVNAVAVVPAPTAKVLGPKVVGQLVNENV